jgi:hypothetical protein
MTARHPLIVEGTLHGGYLAKPLQFNKKRPDEKQYSAIIVPDLGTCMKISDVVLQLARSQAWHTDRDGDTLEYSSPLRYSWWARQWLFYAESAHEPDVPESRSSFIPGQRVCAQVTLFAYRSRYPWNYGIGAELHAIQRIDATGAPIEGVIKGVDALELELRAVAD